jgi:hypothetical protein
MPSTMKTACLGFSQKNEAGFKNRRLDMYQQPNTKKFMLVKRLSLVVRVPQVFHSGVFV